jgi:hypothetical protein
MPRNSNHFGYVPAEDNLLLEDILLIQHLHHEPEGREQARIVVAHALHTQDERSLDLWGRGVGKGGSSVRQQRMVWQ